jgi:hypothetical protein
MRRSHVVMFLAMLLVAVSGLADGVAVRGRIVLVVVDSAGTPIPGATVTLFRAEDAALIYRRQLPSEKELPRGPVITDASGEARFIALTQGSYLVHCQLSGFFGVTMGPIPIELKEPSPRLPEQIRVVLTSGATYY